MQNLYKLLVKKLGRDISEEEMKEFREAVEQDKKQSPFPFQVEWVYKDNTDASWHDSIVYAHTLDEAISKFENNNPDKFWCHIIEVMYDLTI